MQSLPKMLCLCRQPSCPFCRQLCSLVKVVHNFSSCCSAHPRKCPWGCVHGPCIIHTQAIAVCNFLSRVNRLERPAWERTSTLVNWSCLPGICGPGLTGIQQSSDDSDVIHCHLYGHCQLGVCPDAVLRRAIVIAVFQIFLLISLSKERILVMV